MIPIRDNATSRSFPLVNTLLIGVNVLVFFYQIGLGPNEDRFVYFYGLVPARYSIPQITAYFSTSQQIFAFISFMFLHGSFWHLIGNMWSLFIFGNNVEDRLGPLRYLVFYLLSGLASGWVHLYFNYHSNIPTIGASGAIAGVMGGYLLLNPHSKILTLIPIIFIPYFIEVPSYLFMGIWFFLQVLNAAGSNADMGGIAWWAHIGGFVCGMFFLKIAQYLPSTGVSQPLRKITAKKKSHHLQVVRPVSTGKSPDLYGIISVTPFEAAAGTVKVINVPWGFHKRIFRINIPPGVREGSKLRLKSMGQLLPNGSHGDLYLKVQIQN
jgi:membrane associated rhomboid family serine protease